MAKLLRNLFRVLAAGLVACTGLAQAQVLAVGSAERFPLAPNVPTLLESGLPVFGESWYGLMVSKNTPPPVFAAIVNGIRAVAKDEALLASIRANGGMPVFSTPEQFDEYARTQRQQLNTLLAKYPLTQ